MATVKNNELVKNAVNNYVQQTTSNLTHLSNLSNQFQTWHSIKLQVYNCTAEFLQEIKQDKNVLYYFEILSSTDVIKKNMLSVIKTIKGNKKIKVKLPQVNDKSLSNILYVGKSTTSFNNRLKQHVFSSSKSTYALHFSHWNDLKLPDFELLLHYCSIDFDYDYEKGKHLLEMIETSLHQELNPLLGRSGH